MCLLCEIYVFEKKKKKKACTYILDLDFQTMNNARTQKERVCIVF